MIDESIRLRQKASVTYPLTIPLRHACHDPLSLQCCYKPAQRPDFIAFAFSLASDAVCFLDPYLFLLRSLVFLVRCAFLTALYLLPCPLLSSEFIYTHCEQSFVAICPFSPRTWSSYTYFLHFYFTLYRGAISRQIATN